MQFNKVCKNEINSITNSIVSHDKQLLSIYRDSKMDIIINDQKLLFSNKYLSITNFSEKLKVQFIFNPETMFPLKIINIKAYVTKDQFLNNTIDNTDNNTVDNNNNILDNKEDNNILDNIIDNKINNEIDTIEFQERTISGTSIQQKIYTLVSSFSQNADNQYSFTVYINTTPLMNIVKDSIIILSIFSKDPYFHISYVIKTKT